VWGTRLRPLFVLPVAAPRRPTTLSAPPVHRRVGPQLGCAFCHQLANRPRPVARGETGTARRCVVLGHRLDKTSRRNESSATRTPRPGRGVPPAHAAPKDQV
jgi:hypothetical protein